ncbi:PREDICTED: major facilitator superfamily domain-containing protein 2B [Miniopterus natalensis]|uniref:major facilitator superfamily domain-containing protein 2B n=1 Tax=Miniopterus natalensis TaxID=291302 RepID=UPI0007A6A8B4|nr:PREDICTED: major facilitator superfamily domain-containing protein 2B [Miniopterus natalensis]
MGEATVFSTPPPTPKQRMTKKNSQHLPEKWPFTQCPQGIYSFNKHIPSICYMSSLVLGTGGAVDRRAGRLPFCTKVCYGIGGVPNQAASSATAFYLQLFLLDVAQGWTPSLTLPILGYLLPRPFQIPAAQVSLVLFGGKVSGAAADPLAGFFISRSRRTGSGRLMPWVLGCTPFIAAAYFFLWFLPPFTNLRGLWYMTFYCLFQALSTVSRRPPSWAGTPGAPLQARGPSEESVSRGRGQEGPSADPSLVAWMHPGGTGSAEGPSWALSSPSPAGLIGGSAQHSRTWAEGPSAPFGRYSCSPWCPRLHGLETSHPPQLCPVPQTCLYSIAAAVVAVTYPVCSGLLCLGVKERPDPSAPVSSQDTSFLAGLGLTVRHPPYLKLVVSFLFISAAVQVEQSYLVLFCTHASRLHGHVQSLVLTVLVSAVLSTPLWEWVLQRFGKKMSAFGICVMVPFAILLAVVPTAPVAYVVAFVSGVSTAVSLLLPWSMLPDVIDDFQLQHPHGPGMETIFYSSYVFFTKLSGAGALGISTLSLEFAGYKAGACKQAEQVVVTLKVLIGAMPTCMILTGLCILMVGPTPEVPSQETSRQLSLRRWAPHAYEYTQQGYQHSGRHL